MTTNERRLRLVSGLVLTVYVVGHFGNHTLGLFSVEAMDAVRRVISPIWQTWIGTVALYGALATHFALALRSLYRRTTLRMPAWEAVQLGAGALIVPLLAAHVIGTRVSRELLDLEISYTYVVSALWLNDRYTIQQPVLMLLIWTHLTVGLHFWLRLKRWYRQTLPYLYAGAVLLPALAILGFVRAGLSLEPVLAEPDIVEMIFSDWNSRDPARRELILGLEAQVLWGFALLLGATLVARAIRAKLRNRRHQIYRIHHSSGRVLTAPIGQSVLEAVRGAGIPHASVCGGRARCTTCRIRVGEGLEDLEKPLDIEARALARIGAAPNVRLACQTRPRRDLAIVPLLGAQSGARDVYSPGGVKGREQLVAAMFVDLRASTRLGELRMPYDVVFILNQFFAEMSDALQATNGHYAQFSGDGLMALYGLHSEIDKGCRDALSGAQEMIRRLDALNCRLSPELAEPLRIGIGIHSGEAIVGTMGPPTSPNFSAIGDNINIAARLEAQTKVFDCTLVVSRVTAERAGVDLSAFPLHSAAVRGRAQAVSVYAVDDPRNIRGTDTDA